ncbi:MAG: hypothetical protein AAGI70_00375 [Pseudomonadota bacterium]
MTTITRTDSDDLFAWETLTRNVSADGHPFTDRILLDTGVEVVRTYARDPFRLATIDYSDALADLFPWQTLRIDNDLSGELVGITVLLDDGSNRQVLFDAGEVISIARNILATGDENDPFVQTVFGLGTGAQVTVVQLDETVSSGTLSLDGQLVWKIDADAVFFGESPLSDARPWQVRETQFDAEGAADLIALLMDDGTEIYRDIEGGVRRQSLVFDAPSDERPWTALHRMFDETGALTETIVFRDDGRAVVTTEEGREVFGAEEGPPLPKRPEIFSDFTNVAEPGALADQAAFEALFPEFFALVNF